MIVAVCVKPARGEINPFDASALEMALRLKDRFGASVCLVSMGRPETAVLLADLLRRGADRAVLLTDPAFAGADTLATAYTLSLAMRKLSPDLILCGRQSIDSDTAQTGPSLAATLDWPQVTRILSVLDIRDGQVNCRSRNGEYAAPMPALITAESSCVLRFMSIRHKPKPVERWGPADLGADLSRCGLAGSPTRVLRYFESEVGRRQCRFIQASEVAAVIRQANCKVFRPSQAISGGGERLHEIWLVGDGLAAAESLAEHVRRLPLQDPLAIAEQARAEKPDAIFWRADEWGRDHAPRAAVALQTGLCADCTGLEVQDGHLVMIRPTDGGSMMARIECRTRPQMATVRDTDCQTDDMIVAGGRGARNCFGLVEKLAARLGSLGASRSAVDLGLAPYEAQIGLTGRFVSPSLYIACGISGAVQHTCAIEKAGTVIAINHDPLARIFEHADYGVVADAADALENIFHLL